MIHIRGPHMERNHSHLESKSDQNQCGAHSKQGHIR